MAVPLPVSLQPWLPKKACRKVLGSWGGWVWVGVYRWVRARSICGLGLV